MKTITARELRENLDQIVARVRNGEAIRVTYRSKPAFILQPEKLPESIVQGSREAMRIFIKETIKISKSKPESNFKQNKNVKDIYHTLLDSDVKYHGNLAD